MASFVGLNTQVLGISVDHVPCLKVWANHLGGISYPLCSDFWPHGEVARCYGVLRPDGCSERALFVIDREGILRYIDIHNFDQQPDNDELRAVLRQIDPEAALRYDSRSAREEPPLPREGVVMYCTPWCDDCKRARSWFQQLGIPYTEVDISRSQRGAAQVRTWANGNLTTPTFEIHGRVIVDFDIDRLKQALNLA